MRYLNNRRKGMVLMFCLYFVIILAGLSSAAFIRVMSESSNYAREKDRIIAFYNAEAGLAYSYAELAQHNFNWVTIDEDGEPVVQTPSISGGVVSEGIYSVAGKGFQAKIFSEYRAGVPTGIIVIRSQGVSNNVTRSLEYRVAQESAYQYFFFFSAPVTFSGVTYNGQNYGGIHVNGSIIFNGDSYFKYLTELTCSGFMSRYGYMSGNEIKYPQRPNLSGTRDYPTSSTNVNQIDTSAYNPWYSNAYNFYGSNYYLFNSGSIYFTIGDSSSGEAINKQLTYLSGSGAEWSFDEYPGSSASTFKYTIANDDLKNLATREVITKSDTYLSNYYGLLSADKAISVTVTDLGGNVSTTNYPSEQAAFQEAYNAEAAGNTVDWSAFWDAWKINHGSDYTGVTGLTSDSNKDWERRFFQAAYNWGSGTAAGMGSGNTGINNEWISDMSFGDDRSDGDLQAATPYDGSTNYYLKTDQQKEAFAKWLTDNNLDTKGKNLTKVADGAQGGKYIDTQSLLNSYADTSALRTKAKNGGIYIGLDDSGNFSASIGGTISTANLAKLQTAGIIETTSFYNSANPGRDKASNSQYVLYEPSAVLKIDVGALKDEIETEGSELANFNGIIYVDLPGTDWSGTARTDYRADGVMLYNGQILPESGLSLVTTNNVFIEGNYNLHTSTNEALDTWQPAEVISSRYVYTLSDKYPEPDYMPMSDHHYNEYHEENYFNTVAYDYVDNWYFPNNSWVRSAQDVVNAVGGKLKTWVDYQPGYTLTDKFDYDSYLKTGGYWSNLNEIFELDTNSDSAPDTYILAYDLFNSIYSAAETDYDNTFGYTKVHGSDGSQNLTSPSQANSVSGSYTYNTAVISPYSVGTMEYWSGATRTICGAFIKLPVPLNTDGTTKYPVTSSANYARSNNPSAVNNIYKYEIRYGKSSSDQPNTGLTFGADSSWREVNAF